MGKIREFLRINKLRQVDLAAFLGVSEAAISQVVKGKSSFSKENLIKILDNTCGWETEMLIEEEKPQLELEEKPRLSDVEILLRDMLAEKDAKIDTLNEVIWELKTEIGRLQEQIRILNNEKGNDASDAGSGIANVG